MYQKYHTDAIVLGSRPQGEADRLVSLYTLDFGLVRARAAAARAECSRMRYSLLHGGRADVSLIRGKRSWRLAGASVSLEVVGADERGMRALARIMLLVERLVTGEEENPYLFSALAEAQSALVVPACDAHATIELVCVARILYTLGYLSVEALDTALFTHTAYASDSLREAEGLRNEILVQVNRAIAEIHL